MKKTILTLALALVHYLTFAQAPALQWQKCLGGTITDHAYSIQPTPDGGSIVAGYTTSTNGDVTGNHGGYDAWVMKLSATGTLEWQKALGGLGWDYAYSIQPTPDGGYIVAGFTDYTNGDATGNYGNDAWVVKLSATGALEWQKALGGTSDDSASSIQLTPDGGYIMAGYTASTDGDVTGNHGSNDAWVVKLSSTGSLQWQKALGGTSGDGVGNIQATLDGGYILAGYTQSTNGDVSGNHGLNDAWVVKLSAIGTLEWQKALGGTSSDLAHSIQLTTDGGYILAGNTASSNGDVTGNHGNQDAWVVKLSATGTIQWQKALGGTSSDYAQSIQPTNDGGYIVAGYTASTDGNVTGNHGGYDAWVVKLAADLTPAPIANAQTLTTGSTVANLVATGSNLQWYTAATGGTALATSTVLATGTYYVSQTVGGVESTRTSVAVTITSPYTAIPDANFEQALFDQGIDTVNGDHQVLTSAISGVTSLDVSFKNIADLTGIQDFISITNLNCIGNQLTSLNVSGASALTHLDCSNNSLTSLNVSGLTALTHLYCHYNQLTSLNVSGLTALSTLNCTYNQLTSLNVSGATALYYLSCYSNLLTSLNVSGLTTLTILYCSNNQLTSLNVSGDTALINLDCWDNQLTTLNVSGLTALTTLYCYSNLLTSLNVSGLTALTTLYCYINSNLSCITVSDPTAAVANSNWIKDATASYSTNCSVINIPTSKVRAALCGATLSSLSANINADYVAGYQAYRFEVTNGATVNTVEVNKYNFSLTKTPGITYNTTYGVRVAVKMGGTWGAYGASCNVTTPVLIANVIPTTTIKPSFCGTTLSTIHTKIPAKPVYKATGYRFEITTGGVTTVYDSTSYNFKLSQTGAVLANSTTYAIRVAALVDAVYANYGTSCTVTTPAAPAPARLKAKTYEISAYPKPFETAFN